MTIIYDMANGNIQSETAMESRCPDETTVAVSYTHLTLPTICFKC